MNIRKIAKWFGLRWSNRVEKLLPRFENDMLVLANRTLNNSDVAFNDKIQALYHIRQEFENPWYYQGLLRIYGTYQLFGDMSECLKEMQAKKLPYHTDIRDIISNYACVRPYSADKEEEVRELLKVYKQLVNIPLPFSSKDGEVKVDLKQYIAMYKPESLQDWDKLSGTLAVDEKHEIQLELLTFLEANGLITSGDILRRVFRASVILEDTNFALKVFAICSERRSKVVDRQILNLVKLLDNEDRIKFAGMIDLDIYKNSTTPLLNFVLRYQPQPDLTLTEAFQKLKASKLTGHSQRIYHYTALMTVLAKSADVKGVEALWKSMADEKLEPSIKSYVPLMDVYSRAGHGDKVIEVFDNMNHKTPRDCSIHISVLLDSIGFNNDLATLELTWNKLKRHDYRLTTNNYTSYLEALNRLNRTDMAVQTFCDEMCKARIVEPDLKSKDTLIQFINNLKFKTEFKDKKALYDQYLERIENAFKEYKIEKLQAKFK